MKEFLERIYDWIYGKTGVFDTILFSLPAGIAVLLVYWFVRRAVLKHKLGAEYKERRRGTLVNEIIRLLLVGWIAETVLVTLTPSYFWGVLWLHMINGEWSGGLWEFSLNAPQLMPTMLRFAIDGHLEWLFVTRFFVVELAVNVALFVPLGLLLPFIFKRLTLLKTMLIGFAGSFLIEFLQCFITNRDSNVDDLICNTLGAVIGYLLYLLIKKLFPNFTEKAKKSPLNE